MQVKSFEDLEIWKDARLLTRGIINLQEIRNSLKISLCAIKSGVQRSRLCRISLKVLNVPVIKSSFSFCMWPKRRAGKSALNCT